MVKYLLSTICIVFATCAMAAASGSPVPAPAAATTECSSLIYDLMDCMEFLVAGGSETTPDSSCCLGFKNLMEINEDCMCYALDAASTLGLEINMTRAVALPADCRVSSPPISNCHVASSPSGSPANSPLSSAPILPPVAAPVLGGAPTVAPVSAPIVSPREAPIAGPIHAPVASPEGAPIAGPIHAPIASSGGGPIAGPTHAPAVSSAPAVAPTVAPSSEVAAPTPIEFPEFPTESGAWAISATFSVLQLLVILIFIF